MKQPTAPDLSPTNYTPPNLYPGLPSEDGPNYRLQKISEIKKISQQKCFKKISKTERKNNRQSLLAKYQADQLPAL